MSKKSKIEYADRTWDVVAGCTKVSPGCQNCYALRYVPEFAKTNEQFVGLSDNGEWTGIVRPQEDKLLEPLKWKKPCTIFVCSMADLFHELVPFDFIDRVFAVMALCPQHTFLILTKRPERMAEYVSGVNTGERYHDLNVCAQHLTNSPGYGAILPTQRDGMVNGQWPLSNVWLGTTVENQAMADLRVPALLACPAVLRFLSCEPLLGQVDLTSLPNAYSLGEGQRWLNALGAHGSAYVYEQGDTCNVSGIHLIIAGGESGPGARPVHPEWVMLLRNHCECAGVPFNFKQWGEWLPVATPRLDYKGPRVIMDTNGNQREASWGDVMLSSGSEWAFERVGKKNSGCFLYGVEYKEWPKHVVTNGSHM
jgi:protein gp37